MTFLFPYFLLHRRVEFRELSVGKFFLNNTLGPDPTDLQLHLLNIFNIPQILDLHRCNSIILTLVVEHPKGRPNIDHILGIGSDLPKPGLTL